MNNIDDLLVAISRSSDPVFIASCCELISDQSTSAYETCHLLASLLSQYGIDMARAVFAAAVFEVPAGDVSGAVAETATAGLAAILELRGHEDKHPLSYPVGQFSDSHELDVFLGEFCMNLAGWKEEPIREITTIALGECVWCARAVACVVTWWCWENWWYSDLKQLPGWIISWLGELSTKHPSDAALVRQKLRLRFNDVPLS